MILTHAVISVTSFSFASALYPYQIAVIVFIDDATDPVYIDLQDYDSPVTNSGPGTVPHQVVYTSPTEEYAQHTLRILIPDDELYAVVDQITYECFFIHNFNVTLEMTNE